MAKRREDLFYPKYSPGKKNGGRWMEDTNHISVESERKESSGILYKLLRIITVIYPGEGITAFLLTFNIFLLMAAYYIIKPVREALILAGKGAEIKSYLSAAIAVLLIFAVKAFSSVSSRFPRQKLITWVTLFFISNLVIFYGLSFTEIELGTMGIIFFLWVGVFNVMVVAQFWGFANDIYSEEEGKRLFPLVAFGASFGSFSGSAIAGWLVKPLGLYQMMLVTGGMLGICIVLTLLIHNREIARAKKEIDTAGTMEAKPELTQEKSLEKGGGFRLIFKKKYLLYLAFFVLLLNFINTNGEFILGDYVARVAQEVVAAGESGGLDVSEYIGVFMAGFFRWANLLGLLIQLFLVSRIFKWVGVRGALFVLPFIALGGYFLIAAGATLMIVKWVKVTENGTDYSLMNTTRHSLWLVTTREEKYKAQAAIKTFFHRSGDVLSSLIVFLGVHYLAFNTAKWAGFNVALCAIWIMLGVLIVREHKKLSSA
jgi:AAA family ATP:ADP antiporter